MSEFGNRLKRKMEDDNKHLRRAIYDIEDLLLGYHKESGNEASSELLKIQLEIIADYHKVKLAENIPDTEEINETIDYFIRPSGMMKRHVDLKGKWWKDGVEPLLVARKESGEVLALIPGKFTGYNYIDKKTGNKIKVNARDAESFEEGALCFYRPLPEKEIGYLGLISFLLKDWNILDIILLVISCFYNIIAALILPSIAGELMSQVMSLNSDFVMWLSFFLLLYLSVANYVISVLKYEVVNKAELKMEVRLKNAVMQRILRFPLSFFKDKSVGSVAQKIEMMDYIPKIVTQVIAEGSILLVSTIIYLYTIRKRVSMFFGATLMTIILQLVVIFICFLQERSLIVKQIKSQEDTQGFVYNIITGIQRIKLSGSENKAFSIWARKYKDKVISNFKKPFPLFAENRVLTTISLLGLIQAIAGNYSLTTGSIITAQDYAFFSIIYSLLMTNIILISDKVNILAYMRPIHMTSKDIFMTLPEIKSENAAVRSLTGQISMTHVSFKYAPDAPYVLDDIDLHINAGEYVAIVGYTGCGKSTLLKLLLGFYQVNEGAIYYDNMNLDEIDVGTLRKYIGTVLQDGKLFPGDIRSNITISAPWITEDDAWEAAEIAGMADSIRQMPMGMNTLISEGSGGISGGQKQRIMIARAVASKPSILLFDEATSALDNITQKVVSDSLDKLNCTRIVIAHRLSTIKNCDRIIALDKGKIVEDGTYSSLIEKNGFFAELVRRQEI